MRLVAAGLILGSACAAAVERLIGTLIFGAPPANAVLLVGGCAILVFAAAAAACLPAMRAASVDPMQALRSE
jgi:ABC-type antimicrobial peptide transport system permease subunit